MEHKSSVTPHVLIFPLPLQGPVNCQLKLAEILCPAGIHVTLLNTQHIQNRLLSHTDVHSRFSRYPNFRFMTLPDGLPEDNPRSVDQFLELIHSLEGVTKRMFRELLSSILLPVTCIIADGFLSFWLDIADDIGIPLIFFETISPSALWIYLCLPKLVQDFDPTSEDCDLDELITSVPGMKNFLRRRDFPRLSSSQKAAEPLIQLLLKEAKQLPRARGLILNTFEELDGTLLSLIRTLCANVYNIGPLHLHLKTRRASRRTTPSPISSNCLWEEDKSCIAWLDMQPPKSVIYVSIGSLAVMTVDQLMEFWHGLVNSKAKFLWVRRQGSVTGTDEQLKIPAELEDGTRERGCIVNWAPQEEVLGHPAIGGFLTHSGWNSTLESIVEGVPMICWPYFVDQQVNSRMVGEVWKLGLDMKDVCNRVTVEKMIRDLMEVKRAEFVERADKMAKLAKNSVSEGGSSYCDLDRLIEDIKLLSAQAKATQHI